VDAGARGRVHAHPSDMLAKAPRRPHVPVPAELAAIIKDVSPLLPSSPPASMGAHLEAIEARKAHESASFLRAAMMRLQNT
jgi:hypothetical protein